jgi:AMP-binding enzyme
MILGEPAPATAAPADDAHRMSIEEIFRSVARRRPAALALADPPNRESFTDGEPRRLTYAETDRIITAIAGRLRGMGLPTDAVVGVQLPNIVENILAMLAVMRAGMIAAPLPLLWRRADAVTALMRVGAKALITCGHVGSFHHAQFAMRVAADVFSIRYVCGFGGDLPDGVVPFDDLFTASARDPRPLQRERQSNATAHVAAITFDIGVEGLVPVARSHAELLAGGLAVLLESGLTAETNILSTFAPASFAGICLTLLPWLLTGGTLVLHHAFDPAVLAQQWRHERCGTLILPDPVAFRLAATGAFAADSPALVIAAWRSPERLAASPIWREPNTLLVDVPIFGEVALAPARRGDDGKPSPIPLGPLVTPRDSTNGAVVAELVCTDAGTVAMRGPMVPHHSFPPGAERSGLPYCKIGHRGLIDTGYTCRVDAAANAVVITGPPSGIVSIGGYRFPLRDLLDVVGRIDGGATLAALPDPIIGQRLIGNAADRETMRAALAAVGVNPLVVAAFADRGAGVSPH